jgi:hypothetical protein
MGKIRRILVTLSYTSKDVGLRGNYKLIIGHQI